MRGINENLIYIFIGNSEAWADVSGPVMIREDLFKPY